MTAVAEKLRGGIGDEPKPVVEAPKPKKVDPQSIVSAYVAKYGANVKEWAEWPAMLASFGLTTQDVTPEMFKVADEEVRKHQIRRPERLCLLIALPLGSWFRTLSGKKGRLLDVNESEVKVEIYDDKGKLHGRQGWSATTEVEPLDCEAEDRARAAAEVARKEEARQRLEEHRKNKGKKDMATAEQRTATVQKLKISDDPADQELALALERNRETKPKAKGTTSTGRGGKKDRFGCRLGGEPALVNSVLTSEPQTAEQIATQIGLTPERVNWQLKYYQREKGYVKLTDKGWVLVEGWSV